MHFTLQFRKANFTSKPFDLITKQTKKEQEQKLALKIFFFLDRQIKESLFQKKVR